MEDRTIRVANIIVQVDTRFDDLSVAVLELALKLVAVFELNVVSGGVEISGHCE